MPRYLSANRLYNFLTMEGTPQGGTMPSGGAVLVEPVPMQEPRNWGVLGHLSEEQTKSMKAFIESSKLEHLEMVKFSVESIEQVALRFLRARQFDNAKSTLLLEECINRMIEGKATECAAAAPDDNAQCDVELMKNWYPHTCSGFDKFARPILWEHSGGTNPNVIATMTNRTNLVKYHWMTMEKVLDEAFTEAKRRIDSGSIQPEGDNIHQNISTCVVLDMAGFGMLHCSSKMLEHVKSLVSMDNVCYPETLGKMFVINAPWLCVSSWSIVKGWLDPRTQAKIEILGSGIDTLNKLAEVIPMNTIPTSMGGEGPNVFSKKSNAEYVTIPRSGSTTRSIIVDAGKKLKFDTYIIEGTVDLTLTSSVCVENSSPSDTLIMPPSPSSSKYTASESDKATVVPKTTNETILHKSTLVGGGENVIRTLLEYPAAGEQKLFSVTWTNSARLYSRQLVFAFTIE